MTGILSCCFPGVWLWGQSLVVQGKVIVDDLCAGELSVIGTDVVVVTVLLGVWQGLCGGGDGGGRESGCCRVLVDLPVMCEVVTDLE